MNLIPQIKKLCELYEIKPARSKGQNFLISEKTYDEIVEAAEITDADTVLEVGPGLGFLTAKLAKVAKQVIAVELDDKLAEVLGDAVEVNKVENVKIINENILEFPNDEARIKEKLGLVGNGKYKIVANLPYNITSIFLRKFLSETELKPESMTLMLQKEVAERIAAEPPDMSLLAISVQFYSKPKIIRYVSKGNFWPSPEVDSAIIKLDIGGRNENEKGKGIVDKIKSTAALDEKKFFRLVKHGFSARRRMLKNNLAGGLRISNEEAEKALRAAGLNPKIRAEGLTVENWVELFGELEKFMV